MDLSKFNVGDVISNHLKTLKDQRKNKYSLYDIVFSFVAPLVIAILLSSFGHPITTSSVGVIVTAFSVFAAFLLNILVVLFTMFERAKDDNGDSQKSYNSDLKRIVIKETYHNISFALLLSIFIVVLMILLILLPSIYLLTDLLAGIGDFLIFIFIATILLILKRINAIISKEFT